MKNLQVKHVLFGLLIFFISGSAFAQQNVSAGHTEWDDGIMMFKSDDGNFKTRFDTRMFLNGAYFFENKNELSNGTHLRKARFAMKLELWKTWRAEWDIDIAEGLVEVKDMFFSYNGFTNSHIKAGHFKMPLGLNELMSSRYQTFIERAYPMLAFETDRRAGLEYSKWGHKWNLRSAIYGQTMDTEKNKRKDETGNGAAARLVYAPVRTDNFIIHTGLAAVYQKPDDETGAMDFASEPETKIGDTEILDTGTILNVHHSTKYGLEGAFVYKNLSAQAEYIQTNLRRINGAQDATFQGGYAFLSWILTGESRPWNSIEGEFGQVTPKSNKTGAWEIAARYSHLDLSDDKAGIYGGMANNYTGALNWYVNPNIRLMLNYTYVDHSINATGEGFIGDDDFSVLHVLAMVYF
ncbi:MAG: hypothetical protein H6696_19755 [Deferribacteres bacterium]|nr:hypothetical protein [candidate division KSB1 bacterium]MCB9504165.1 hypothetical protein [Deferribacteres bacterium]